MSHFVVLVRLDAELLSKHSGSVLDALTERLAPYQENNMGDCPKQFMTFHDVEDDERSDYAEADEETKSKYPTFAEYVEKYSGYKKDSETGRYGYWENPNKKWDWWVLGGRWTGYFPVKRGAEIRTGDKSWLGSPAKPGRSDAVRVSEIDFDKIATEAHAQADKFYDEWSRFIAGEKLSPFEGPRSLALSIGLITVRQGPPEPGEQSRAIPWSAQVAPGDPRAGWHDVYTEITREELLSKYLECFSPINAYAVLDEKGWSAPGEMGWFAISSETPEQLVEHARTLTKWLREAGENDLIAAVDCHI